MLAAIAIAVLLSASAAASCCPKPLSLPSGSLLTLLQRVQSATFRTLHASRFDPKLYVDLPLRYALPTVERAFDDLSRNCTADVTREELEGFLGKYFESAGDDLVDYVPPDYVDFPEGFLPKVEDRVVREWALEVHSLWRNLSRRVSESVLAWPDRHTLISLPGPVVVPGSRFREVYYWDSYWVISARAFGREPPQSLGIQASGALPRSRAKDREEDDAHHPYSRGNVSVHGLPPFLLLPPGGTTGIS